MAKNEVSPRTDVADSGASVATDDDDEGEGERRHKTGVVRRQTSV